MKKLIKKIHLKNNVNYYLPGGNINKPVNIYYKDNGVTKNFPVYDWDYAVNTSNSLRNKGSVPINILPEITVKKHVPIILDTWYPFTSEDFPLTGHSKLRFPVNQFTTGGKGLKNYPKNVLDNFNKVRFYKVIDVRSDDKGYNLVTNNCSDATMDALQLMFNDKDKTYFFTTPGDVLSYAIKHGGKSHRVGNGHIRTIIPRTEENYKMIDEGIKKYMNKEDKLGNLGILGILAVLNNSSDKPKKNNIIEFKQL